MRGWWRRPLLHFFVLGGALLLLDRQLDAAGPALLSMGDASARSAPLSDEELLYRDARARGLERSDALVQRRLIRDMRFVSDAPDARDEDLLAQALALGLDESDLVVRRRLVQRVALDEAAAARRQEPSEAELRDYLERHAERFAQPARVRLSQVFLSRQRRGASLASDAEALGSDLAGAGPDAGAACGDPLPLPRTVSGSRRELAAMFGEDFASAAFDLPGRSWQGPVASAYGLHWVWIHQRLPARPAALASVRSALREGVLEERADAALRERLAWLRSRR